MAGGSSPRDAGGASGPRAARGDAGVTDREVAAGADRGNVLSDKISPTQVASDQMEYNVYNNNNNNTDKNDTTNNTNHVFNNNNNAKDYVYNNATNKTKINTSDIKINNINETKMNNDVNINKENVYIYKKGTVEELPDVVAPVYRVKNNNDIDMNDTKDKDVCVGVGDVGSPAMVAPVYTVINQANEYLSSASIESDISSADSMADTVPMQPEAVDPDPNDKTLFNYIHQTLANEPAYQFNDTASVLRAVVEQEAVIPYDSLTAVMLDKRNRSAVEAWIAEEPPLPPVRTVIGSTKPYDASEMRESCYQPTGKIYSKPIDVGESPSIRYLPVDEFMIQHAAHTIEDPSTHPSKANNALFVLRTKVFAESDAGKCVDTVIQFDQGGTINIIDRALAVQLGCEIRPCRSVGVSGIGGSTGYSERCKVYMHMEGMAYHSLNVKKNGTHDSFFLGVECYIDDDPVFPMLIGANTMEHLHMTCDFMHCMDATYRYIHVGKIEGWKHSLRLVCSPPAEWKIVRKIREYRPIVASVYVIDDEEARSRRPVDLLMLELNKKEVRRTQAQYPKPKTSSDRAVEARLTMKEKRKLAAKKKAYIIKNQNEDTAVLEYNNIIAEWALSPEDDLDSLPVEDYINRDVPTGGRYEDPLAAERPEQFPLEYWRLLPLSQQARVRERWKGYSDKDLADNIKEILEMDVCDKRPNQRPYCIAQALAFMPAYFLPGRKVQHMRNHEFTIETHDKRVIRVPNRRLSPLMQAFCAVKFPDMMEKGFIEHSTSEYRNPMHLVPYQERIKAFLEKHLDDATAKMADPAHAKEVMAFYRFCMDFRQLNDATVADQFPMPNTQDVIDRFTGCSYFSTFDLADAFFLVKLREADRHKTAFSTHNMLLQWMSMPQGAKNAAVFFARIMAKEFSDRPATVDPFQDDISVHAKSFYELLTSQDYIYNKVIDLGITVKMSKAHINMARTRVLGHLVTAGGYRIPDPKCVKPILDWDDKMASKDDIGRLIGMIGFQREYIRGLSDLLAPLIDIKNADGNLEDWKDEVHGEAVRIIKKILVSAPFLLLPDPSKKFRIHVDTATGRSIGGVLLQYYGKEGQDNTLNDSADGWRVVSYYSRLLKQNSPEHHLAPTEAEALGMYECIKHWETYIENGRPFDVIVDHKALVSMVKSTADCANKSIMRRILALQGYTFNVIYKQGGKHLDADAVSRLLRFADREDAGTVKAFGPVPDDEVHDVKRMAELLEGTRVGLVPNRGDPEDALREFDAMSNFTKEDNDRERMAMSNKDFILSGEPVLELRFHDSPTESKSFIVNSSMILNSSDQDHIDLCTADAIEPYADDPHSYQYLDTGGQGMVWMLKHNLVRDEYMLEPRIRESDDDDLIAHHNYATRGGAKLAGRELQRLILTKVRRTARARQKKYEKAIAEAPAHATTVARPDILPPTEGPPPRVTDNPHRPITLGAPDAAEHIAKAIERTTPPELAPKQRKRGPKTVKGKITTPLEADEEIRAARIQVGETKAYNYQHLIGRIFRHPDNNQTYEVAEVHYDPEHDTVAAFREPIHESAASEADRLCYAVEGNTGIAKLVEKYNQFADLETDQPWPQNEAQMLALQQNDPEWQPILKMLKGTTDRFVPYMGHFECFQPTLLDGSQGALRIRRNKRSAYKKNDDIQVEHVTALPKALHALALAFCHENGHPGRDRLHSTMSLQFFWKGMHRDVEAHVNNCSFCTLRKANNRAMYVPTQAYDVPDYPFEFIHIDNIVNLPQTLRGNKHILVIKCRLTKWIEVIALPNLKAATIAQALISEVYARHGTPRVIVSDRGTEFLNSTMKYVDWLLQQYHIYTTPYNPQANGQVENQNRTLKDMLANYVGKFHEDWDMYLPIIKHAYNTTVNAATNYSPFRALYGREAAQTTDTWIQTFYPKVTKDIDTYVAKLQEALMHGWDSLHERIDQRQEAWKAREARLNERRLYVPYAAGEKFYMKTRPKIQFHDEGTKKNYPLAAKLQHRYTGPHTVIRQLNPVTYYCDLHGKQRVVHASKMKRGPGKRNVRTAKLLVPLDTPIGKNVQVKLTPIPLEMGYEYVNDENDEVIPFEPEEVELDSASAASELFGQVPDE